MQSNITKSALSNFHIIGLLLSLKFIFSAQKFEIFPFLAIVVSVLIIFVLFRIAIHYRDTECGGSIKYGQAFGYIFLLYFFGSIISSIVTFIYTRFIDTNLLSVMLDAILKLYDSYKLHLDDQTYTVIETLYKPVPFSLLNIVSSIFSGAFWSLILASLVRKEKNIFEQ